MREEFNAKQAQWNNEKNAIGKVQKLRSDLEAANAELERAQREYDLNKAAELQYGKIPELRKQLEAEETTKSGIVLPGAEKEKPQQAEVIAVGPGGVVDGKEVKMEVKKGDNVIYSKYSGTEVKLDDVTYIIVKQSDILAIIK